MKPKTNYFFLLGQSTSQNGSGQNNTGIGGSSTTNPMGGLNSGSGF